MKIILHILLLKLVSSNFVGYEDDRICQRTNLSLSCLHQIQQHYDYGYCMVHYPKSCPHFYGGEEYGTEDIPLSVSVYAMQKILLRTLALNISFQNPTWSKMYFHLENMDKPNFNLCREFELHVHAEDQLNFAIYWDCLIFSAENTEKNSYSLQAVADDRITGLYTFKIPGIQNYDLTAINFWHVFFIIHKHILERNGKLMLTLQLAPFDRISYSVSLIWCMSHEHTCMRNSSLETLYINQDRYSEQNTHLTIGFSSLVLPGFYVVSVQLMNADCSSGYCASSLSPVFEVKQNYHAEITIGVVAIVFGIFVVTFLMMRRTYLNIYGYIENKYDELARSNNEDEATCEKGLGFSESDVLIVYHAESEEKMILFQELMRLFRGKFYLRTLIIDGTLKNEDPSSWVRRHMSAASRVLFFLPNDSSAPSVTPIQSYFQCALNYFSGRFLKENHGLVRRSACVILPDSSPLKPDHELYSLRRFRLNEDLLAMVNWLHRRKILDGLIFWRPIIQEVSGHLKDLVYFAVNPTYYPKPESFKYEDSTSETSTFFNLKMPKPMLKDSDEKDFSKDFGNDHINEEDSFVKNKSNMDGFGQYPKTDIVHERDSGIFSYESKKLDKVNKEFDPLLPDVCKVYSEDGEHDIELKEDSDDGGDSVTDVMNFAD